jgi:hypothetical protein
MSFHRIPCRLITIIGAMLLAAAVEAQGPISKAQSASENQENVMPCIEPHGKADLQGVDGRIYHIAQRLAHDLLGQVHPWQEDQSMLLMTESKSGEHWIRPNTGAVEGFCFLYRFGPYDEKIVGVSRADLLRKTILPMMRYLTATHVTGQRLTSDGRKWGDHWQSSFWTQMLGRGAWWIWADLPEDLRKDVRRVVVHEADRIAHTTPPHQIALDTKAEENAWNSRILEVAVLLMPNDPRRAEWDAAYQKWVVSSFLRPADEHGQKIVDGRTVAEQFSGANIHDDFTLENHRIVHPDYMGCIGLSLGALVDYSMTGRKPPEAMFYNVCEIYENLKWFALPSGCHLYPNGQDWELFRCGGNLGFIMAVYAHDPDGWFLACRSLDTLEKMQNRFKSGVVYGPDESFFASIQTGMLGGFGAAWLALRTADHIENAPRTRVGMLRLDSGKIILRRTDSAIHAFSWGRKLMAQCIPNQKDQLVSPHQLSGVGHVTLQGETEPLPLNPGSVEVTQGKDWFAARVALDHGEKVRAELGFRSNPDGSWTMREKLTALDDITTQEIATGLIGILNNPIWVYENGKRHIFIDGKEEVVPSLGGKSFDSNQCRDIGIDSLMKIHAQRPMQIRYIGATKQQRGRATDEMYLNFLGGEHSWRKGQTISEFEAVVQCPKP